MAHGPQQHLLHNPLFSTGSKCQVSDLINTGLFWGSLFFYIGQFDYPVQIPNYLNHYVIQSDLSARTKITLHSPGRKEFTTGNSALTKLLEGLKEQESEGTIKLVS